MEVTWREEIFDDEAEPCETCGPAFEYVEVTKSETGYDAAVAVGCFGGDSLVTQSVEDLLDFLRDWEHLDPEGVAAMRESIAREAADLREDEARAAEDDAARISRAIGYAPVLVSGTSNGKTWGGWTHRTARDRDDLVQRLLPLLAEVRAEAREAAEEVGR